MQVTVEDFTSYTSGRPKALIVVFKADGFAGAGELYELAETSRRIHGETGLLMHAFVNEEWPRGCRVLGFSQWLHEKPEYAERFIEEVVRYLDYSELVDPDTVFVKVRQLADNLVTTT